MGAKSQEIQQFIIDQVEAHPRDVVKLTVEKFGITRQAVNRHVKTLQEDGVLEAKGKTSERTYSLVAQEYTFSLPLAENKDEDVVYRTLIAPLLISLPDNIKRVCNYGFTEMFNNVLDHSGGTVAAVKVTLTAKTCSIKIYDDGIGIFERIKTKLGLHDYRMAVHELSKGKLTTAPDRHSGQGVFFTSRMFDQFWLHANALAFMHIKDQDDWLLEGDKEIQGTRVSMEIAINSATTTKEVFDLYTDLESDNYDFSKTRVPLSLAKYKDEDLISRSQAKRVLSRFDRFKEVLLDFKGVNTIGQGFADEIFRVYKQSHPEVEIVAVNANAEVQQMIKRAKSVQNAPSPPESFPREN